MAKQNKLSNAECLRWMNPILVALRQLGGEAEVKDVVATIAKNEHLSYKDLNERRGNTNTKKINNDIAFARNYLTTTGYLSYSDYGVWKLSKHGWSVEMTEELASNIFKRESTVFSKNDYYRWIKFYQKLADKLLDYKNNRHELIIKLIKLFKKSEASLPYYLRNRDFNDIDPFTVFALFNSKNDHREMLFQNINSVFDINSKHIPFIFDAIPSVESNAFISNRKVEFKYNKENIDFLWDLFEKAIIFSFNKDDDSREKLVEVYNKNQKMYKDRFLLTIGLYWIRPNVYISLTDNIYEFISNMDELSLETHKKISNIYKLDFDGFKYIDLCLKLDDELFTGNNSYRSFPQLNYYIWNCK